MSIIVVVFILAVVLAAVSMLAGYALGLKRGLLRGNQDMLAVIEGADPETRSRLFSRGVTRDLIEKANRRGKQNPRKPARVGKS